MTTGVAIELEAWVLRVFNDSSCPESCLSASSILDAGSGDLRGEGIAVGEGSPVTRDFSLLGVRMW